MSIIRRLSIDFGYISYDLHAFNYVIFSMQHRKRPKKQRRKKKRR